MLAAVGCVNALHEGVGLVHRGIVARVGYIKTQQNIPGIQFLAIFSPTPIRFYRNRFKIVKNLRDFVPQNPFNLTFSCHVEARKSHHQDHLCCSEQTFLLKIRLYQRHVDED